jgi:hypothetical protein
MARMRVREHGLRLTSGTVVPELPGLSGSDPVRRTSAGAASN